MPEHDPERSEWATAARAERVFMIVLTVVVVVASILVIAEGAGLPEKWLVGGLAAMVSVFFVPNRRWRMVFGLLAAGLATIALVVR